MGSSELRLHTGVRLPDQLVKTVGAWDQAALTPGWLASLPETVAELCAKWRIELDPVIPESYVTLVLLGRSAEFGPVVIKSSPLADEFRAEATALRLAAAPNVACLYEVDFERSVFIEERIVPGTQLRNVPMSDEDATLLAAETVASMWRPDPDPAGLHPLRQWMRALFEWTPRPDRIDPDLIAHAQELGARLLAGSRRTCLLHGDFQHHNLLQRASGEWVIIDPKGVVGDPGYEIAAWMGNPPGVTNRADYRAIAARRVAICAEVWGIDEQELIAWAIAGMTLNVCWSAADPAPAAWLASLLRGIRELRVLLD